MTTRRPSGERGLSPQLLVELVMDPRDPAYEAAAQRRGGQPARHWYDRPALAVGALIAGFVLALAYVHTNRGAPGAVRVHDDLVTRVRTAEQRATVLATEAQRDTLRLNALRDSALGDAGPLSTALDRDQLLSGELAATGPGLQVTLSEPPAPRSTSDPGRGGTVPIAAGHILTDRDVRSVVNELWAGGAEAIAVNDIRLTPTSAVRFAGQAVLVDFQPIASPYTITAIGDADALATGFAASDVASRYQTLSSAKGIGFSFHEQSEVSVAASPGTTLRYAHVPAGGGR